MTRLGLVTSSQLPHNNPVALDLNERAYIIRKVFGLVGPLQLET